MHIRTPHLIRAFALLASLGSALTVGEGAARAQSQNVIVPVQGLLTDSQGLPLNRTVQVTFSLYADDHTATALWSEVQALVVEGGLFTAQLGTQHGLAADLFKTNQSPYLGVKVDTDPEMSRFLLGSSPLAGFSALSGDAQTIQGKSPGDLIGMRGTNEVPIGAIIDWWRPTAAFPVPAGYQICDGSAISDAQSPFNGFNTPDLNRRFVRGVTDPSAIGSVGGSDVHSHEVDLPAHSHSVALDHTHPAMVTAAAGDHAHSVDLGHSHGTFNSAAGGAHNHAWSSFSNRQWSSYDPQGFQMTVSNQGQGTPASFSPSVYPFMVPNGTPPELLYTNNASAHAHSITVPPYVGNAQSTTAGSHTHAVTIPPYVQTVSTSAAGAAAVNALASPNIPQFVGLLKIMRIR